MLPQQLILFSIWMGTIEATPSVPFPCLCSCPWLDNIIIIHWASERARTKAIKWEYCVRMGGDVYCRRRTRTGTVRRIRTCTTYICINKYLVVSALTRLLKWAMGQSKSKCLHTLTEYGLCGFAAAWLCSLSLSSKSYSLSLTLLDDDYGQKTVSVLVDNIETDLEVIDHPACEMSVSINRQRTECRLQTYVHTHAYTPIHMYTPAWLPLLPLLPSCLLGCLAE